MVSCPKYIFIATWFIIIALSSCNESADKLFTSIPSSQSNVHFKNLLRESEEFNVLNFGYFYNGGGVAVGDINNDGLPDIYFTGNMMASHLYLNQGDFKFKEIATSAGVRAEGLWNTGVTMVDVNADGWLDIYVCRSAAKLGVRRTNQLFINNRDLTFTESAATYGLDDQGYSTQAAFLDYDRDGDLDMFLINHSVQEYAGFGRNLPELKNQRNKEYGDRLYQNNLFMGQDAMIGRFIDVTPRSGINSTVLGFGLGVSVADLNNDGWLDIYVSNDYNEEDYLYINQQDGTFKNEVVSMLDQSSLFSMGNDVADINNDGLPDIITLDMLPEDHQRIQMTSGSDNYTKKQMLYQSGFHKQSMRNMLHLNNGDGSFSEVGQLAGMSNTDWSWAALIEDYDLDGEQDVFITNGYKSDYTNMDFMAYAVSEQTKSQQTNKQVAISSLIEKIPSIEVSNYMYKNNGGFQFENKTKDWGLDGKGLSNGAAYADLDGDGDLDLIVNSINETASLYRNNKNSSANQNSYSISLQGKVENPFAIGTKLMLLDEDDEVVCSKTLNLARGFQSSVDPNIIISDTLVNRSKKIFILWTDGKTQLENLNLKDRKINISYNPNSEILPQPVSKELNFSLLSEEASIAYSHKSKAFNDFDFQALMPFKMSDKGTKVAVGDVNADGLLDYYYSGTNVQAGELFLQTRNGTFSNIEIQRTSSDSYQVEMDAAFIDVDGDKDLDLVVVNSNYESTSSFANSISIYLNDSKGNFIPKERKQEESMNFSSSALSSADYDGDGDMDLFVGGYLAAGSFPKSAESRLLQNDGKGNFKDATSSTFENLQQNQIVTDCRWVDYDQDEDLDLLIVGHWMPVTLCINEDAKLTCDTIHGTSGLWNTIDIVESNNDGYPDIVLGNYGHNSQLQASMEEPLVLYSSDFDSNGKEDPVFCKTIDGEVFPFAFRDDLVKQIPGLKKKFNSYAEYASASISKIFSAEQLRNATVGYIESLASTVLLSNGNKGFTTHELPWQVQQSPIYAIEHSDLNSDGNIDLLLGGNQVAAMEQLGSNLSNKGTVLFGDGKGGFEAKGKGSSGLGVKGEVRDIIKMNDDMFMWVRNNDSLVILKLNHEDL